MLEQKAGIAMTDESVPLLIERDIDELPPMPEIVYADNIADVEQPTVGSALKQSVNGGLPLTMRKRKKKQSTIPSIAKKRYKQRKGMDSDSSFDSSDSENDEEEEDEGPRTIAEPLDEEEEQGPTQIEAVTEAAKSITVEVVRREEEEFDDIKVQLLKSNREGDLAGDVAKVQGKTRRKSRTILTLF